MQSTHPSHAALHTSNTVSLFREDPRLPPTRLTRNPKPASLNTSPDRSHNSADTQRQQRIAEQLSRTREDILCAFVSLVPFSGPKPSGLPEFEEAAKLSQPSGGLIFVFTQESALLKILAANAVSRPRHCIEPFFRQGFAAVNTLSITSRFNAFERFIDQVQQLRSLSDIDTSNSLV